MKNIRRRTAAVFMAALTVLISAGCGAAGQAGVSGENWDRTALEINGEAVSLREWNFYLRMNQMQWEKAYLEQYGDGMWSREAGDGEETMADALKEEVLEIIVRTHLTNQHAEEYGAKLSGEEEEDVRERAAGFMEGYHTALLDFAGADEAFVTEKLGETELSACVEQAVGASYEPELAEEEYFREGICYVLLSTTGLRDQEGNLTPFSDEEVERRTALAKELCVRARESGDLKSEAEAEGLTPIESSMGRDNEGDGQEPRMLDAARALPVGGVSDPVETEEGWFLVQHTSDYDEDGTEYWKEYLTEQARTERAQELYDEWREDAEVTLYQDVMDLANVKDVLKELL